MIEHFPDAYVLRKSPDGDVVYADKVFEPHCGFLSVKEAAILSAAASKAGGGWVEVGSHVGWSAAHILRHAKRLECVDPILSDFWHGRRFTENLRRAGFEIGWRDSCLAYACTSREYFAQLATCMEPAGAIFGGAFIDGNHSSPEPLADAVRSDIFVKPGGCIVLHDTKGQPIMDAVNWLASQGYRIEQHNTMNGIAVCWKPE